MDTKAIGIFDSGIGGLTVLKEIRKLLPEEDIIYLGDTAHVPYGTKSPETVLRYTIRNTLFLLERGVKAVVIACNTASAYGLGVIQKNFKVPVLGVITPGAKKAYFQTRTKKVGVIGTEGTIRSQAYQTALCELDSEIRIHTRACPLLVGLAEEGWFKGEVIDMILATYLKKFKEKEKIDTLILGCTHYPLFKEAIQQFFEGKIELVDSAVELALELKETLNQFDLNKNGNQKGRTSLYSTDSPSRMQEIGHYFLGEKIGDVSKVEIASY